MMSAPNQETTPNSGAPEKPTFKQRVVSSLNLSYLCTLFFFLKLAVIIMEFCGAISVSVRYDNWSSSKYYNFVAVTGIVVAVLVTLCNIFRIVEKLDKVPWIFIEMIFDFLWAILFIIASAIVTSFARTYENMDSYAAAAFFGFSATLIYIIDGTIRLIKLIRGGSGIRIKRGSTNNNQPNAQPQQNQLPNY